MPRNTDYHSGAAVATHSLVVKLSPDDRALLVKLTHARGRNASDVIRDLLRAAAAEGSK